LRERGEESCIYGIVLAAPNEYADSPHAVALLRPRREGPSRRRAADEPDELAPLHSITSSNANAHLPLPCVRAYRGRIARRERPVLTVGTMARAGLRLDVNAWLGGCRRIPTCEAHCLAVIPRVMEQRHFGTGGSPT